MSIDFNRFITAQEKKYDQALSEIMSGRKLGHWMWFVFPQFKGLGVSETSTKYSIQNLEEAQEYINHPILSARLRQITTELIRLEENNAIKVFGLTDSKKLKSSMTLFSIVDNSLESIFKKAIDKFFDGEMDERTLNLIQRTSYGNDVN
jgi:uncharacterized protein (DUF1810 family)